MEENTENPIRNSKEIARKPNGQLEKGVVLNPNGRPSGSLDFKTKWNIFIEKVAKQNDMTPNEIDEQLLAVAFKKAKDGDYAFYRDTQDRVHGKAVTVIEANVTQDSELTEEIINEAREFTEWYKKNKLNKSSGENPR